MSADAPASKHRMRGSTQRAQEIRVRSGTGARKLKSWSSLAVAYSYTAGGGPRSRWSTSAQPSRGRDQSSTRRGEKGAPSRDDREWARKASRLDQLWICPHAGQRRDSSARGRLSRRDTLVTSPVGTSRPVFLHRMMTRKFMVRCSTLTRVGCVPPHKACPLRLMLSKMIAYRTSHAAGENEKGNAGQVIDAAGAAEFSFRRRRRGA